MAHEIINQQAVQRFTELSSPVDVAYELERIKEEHRTKEANLTNFKAYLTTVQILLDEAFQKADIHELLKTRALAVDHLLQRMWAHCFSSETEQCSLVAVGGYGRSELHPHSDIDLLILIPDQDKMGQATQESIEAFITWLWDLGLDIGHSVRDIDTCVQWANDDVTVMTNLLECRRICGEVTLFRNLTAALETKEAWPSEAFFKAKYQEQRDRHTKFRKTSYALEPNIKKSPGALRDIQLIGWVAKRHFNVTQLKELMNVDFLTAHEYESLNHCQEFLWTLRFALHEVAARGEDRLLFDFQKPVAEKLGYQDSQHRSDVEHMMQDYYTVVKTVRELNDMLLQHFSETILNKDKQLEVTPIDDYFQRVGKRIEICAQDTFMKDSTKLLELFLHIAENPDIEGIRAPTLRQIFIDRNQIDLAAFQNDPKSKRLFLQILRHPNGVHALNYMKRYGVLKAYLPVYAQILGQMQYDLFHIYTVDEHTLFVLNNIANFYQPESKESFPLCHELVQQIEQPEILLLGALFHDIGKGRGGDHSQIGAVEARTFCQQHQLTEKETDLVSYLVSDHLVMSMTAQRKDITDPDVIHQFASRVQNIEKLNYLYLLTVADICATNHSLWNNWKDSLLSELYRQTHMALLRGLENPQQTKEAIEETKSAVLLELKNRGYSAEEILTLWDDFKPDYFIRNPAKRIAWQTRKLIKHRTHEVVVSVFRDRSNLATEVFVYMPKSEHYFTLITSLLHKKNLSIQDASLHSTQSGHVMGAFVVLESDGSAIKDHRRIQSITHLLNKKLKKPSEPDINDVPEQHHRYRHFEVATEISFGISEQGNRTLVDITSMDRPGLLAEIGMAFQVCQLELHSAKIVTLGEKVEDVFSVTNRNETLLSEEQQNILKNELLKRID